MLRKREKRQVHEKLQIFGCTDKEAEIYIEAFQAGPSTVQELARQVDINRVTAHSAIESLLKKGLLLETRKRKRRLLVAEEPGALDVLLRSKEQELEEMKGAASLIDRLLSSVKRTDGHLPKVEHYEDSEGFKKLLERTLNAKGEFLAVINSEMFAEQVGRDYLLDFFSRRAKKGIYSRLIFPPVKWGKTVNARAKEFKIQVRELPDFENWRSGIFCWNNCVSIKSLTENRITCTILENEDISIFFRTIIFEMLWAQARPIRS